ncbi:hypothetical protein ML5_5972 [Micromonospora sp. L5]|uniref:hypothetical protein n=1 Tax=Micromonospora sp. (strain L5) TaxID=648999 RepID=UPI0001C444A2|nr:hypothetical protein [Micromonospora sp. L5]ADU11420.1 hypothetical protein ML5_5972 [Micromonospora sp. L5]
MTQWEELQGAAPPRLLRARPLADAEEVLVLTYTCDLSFFEDVCLREAQAVRARTTILYDADQLTQGPRRTDYLALPAVCKQNGAFHPKLIVIASETDAVVAIGSGNATPSGWHHNAEVWALLRSAGPAVPQLFHDLADWLRRLTAAVWMEHLGRDRLDRVAELLTCRPTEPEHDQPTLVTTSTRPIIEQLPVPKAPTTSLAVSAPFFDPRAEALRQLVDRFKPAELQLLLTRDVQCDPATLAEVVKQVPTGIVTTPESSRYHHAKIVEWTTNDQKWALTGSANCSTAALTTTMATGGNCELGLLTATSEPLIAAVPAHPVDLYDPANLQLRKPTDRNLSGASLRVLGVRVSAQRVEATVLTEHQVPAWLLVGGLRLNHERSDGKLHLYVGFPTPDWSITFDEQTTTHVTTDTGTEIRNVVVTDVDAALSRIDRPSPLEHTPLPLVIADHEHMEALLKALADLASVRPDNTTAPAPGTDRRRQVERRITAKVGPALLHFTLGLDNRRRSTPTDDEIFNLPDGDDAASKANKVGGSATASQAPPTRPETVATVLDALTKRQRTNLRRQAEELVDASEEWPLPAKLAVSRLMLTLIAGGLWADETDWTDLLYRVVLQLWLTDQQESLNDEHASLATIGLVALRTGIDRQDEPNNRLIADFDQLRQTYIDWIDWLEAASEETIRRYATGLNGHTLGVLFAQTDFTAELRSIVRRSALDDAVDRLAGARLDGSVVRIAPGRTARKAVIAALDALRDFPDVHVVSADEPAVHGWWNGRRLLLVTRTGASWRAEVWTQLMTGIAAYSRGTPLRPPDRRWTASGPNDARDSAPR